MAVDNIARALAAKALESSTGSVTPEDLEKKYDKTGGAISGDVSIQGDLTVSGTTLSGYAVSPTTIPPTTTGPSGNIITTGK